MGEVATPLPAMAEVYLALEMGLRDYCRKNGIERVYLGLSGGIDLRLLRRSRRDRRRQGLRDIQPERLLL